MFLQFLGFLLIIILAVGGYYGWKYFRSTGALQKTDIDNVIKILPQISLSLDTSNKQAWKGSDRLSQDEEKLGKLGCTHCGYFAAFLGGVSVQYSIWNFKECISVVIKETSEIEGELGMPNVNYSIEAGLKFKGGSTIFVTTSDVARLLPREDKHPIILYKTNDVVEILKKSKAQIKDVKMVERVKDSQRFYMEAYNSHSAWLWEDKQLLSNEMQVLLATSNIEATEDLMQSLVYYGKFSLAEKIEAQIIERFPVQAKLTQEKWNEMRDNIVVVHEKMPAMLLSSALYQILGMPTQSQEEVLDKLEEQQISDNPIMLFHDYYEKWNLKYKAKCIAKTKHPVMSEIYLRTSQM